MRAAPRVGGAALGYGVRGAYGQAVGTPPESQASGPISTVSSNVFMHQSVMLQSSNVRIALPAMSAKAELVMTVAAGT